MITNAYVCGDCGQRFARPGYCAHDGQPLQQTADPLLGTEVGSYRLAKCIGVGGMGQVYMAVQPRIGSRVAVKILSDQCARNPEMLERFFAEARAVNLIRHENIVSVIDMAQLADGRPYIVMEFVEGQTLGAIVRRGSAPLGGVVRALGEVLSALAAAHALGIVHRDLKPDNVMITGEGHAKVLDFGIAKLAPGLANALSPRTRTGALLGTPAYMAPEQINGAGNVDARSDVYAAGVVLFEAVTGRPPFVATQLFELMRAHLEEPPPSPRGLRPDLPPTLEQVILMALAKRPEDRFQSAGAMAAALADASTTIAPAQWRALSARGGAVGGQLSNAEIMGPTPVPTPPRMHPSTATTASGADPISPVHLISATQGSARPQHPATPDRPASHVATVAHRPEAPARRTGLIAALAVTVAVLGVTGAIVAIVATRSGATVASGAAIVGERDRATVASGDAIVATRSGATVASGAAIVVERGRGSGVVDRAGAESPAAPDALADPAPARKPAPVPPPSPPRSPPAAATAPPGPTSPPPPVRTASAATRFTQAADYRPERFDPIAYLPRARTLARTLLDDAELTEFEMYENVRPDGRVDLTAPSAHTSYFEFRSPKRSVRPPTLPKDMAVDLPCRVIVEVTAKQIEVAIRTDARCTAVLRRAPRCSLATVWQRAIAEGLADGTPVKTGNVVATVGFLRDGTWFFDLDRVRSFPDC